MKKRLLGTLAVMCMASVMLAGFTVTASAASNPFAALETRSKQAVEAAVNAGIVPAGTTMYDCAFTTGADGVTRVIQYKGKSGNWIDVTSGVKTDTRQNAPAAPKTLTADELKGYADEMFELVNKEREKAGAGPLVRDSLLDEAAMIRADEIKVVDDAGGNPHTRPDGTSYKSLLDDMGVNGKRCGENISRGRLTPEAAMKSLMQSTKGHRENILRDNYGSIGIGVYQRPDGWLDFVQIFMLK